MLDRIAPIIIIFGLSTSALGQTAVQTAQSQGASDDDSILKYWPIDAPSRHWDLFETRNGANSDHVALSISNQTLGKGRFVLWFSKPVQAVAGATNGEEYRYCYAMGRAWIFLEEYLSGTGAGQWAKRPVKSSRILLTVDNGAPEDLMANGTYAGCGSTGQPYLFASRTVQKYHLQVWGYMTNNPRYKWYWDAYVSKPNLMTNSCLRPPQTVNALKVQEAWWSNFAEMNGNANTAGWTVGSSGNLGTDGIPDGTGVNAFRTVWHAEGQIPYYSTASPDGGTIRRCIKRMPAREQ